MALDSRRTPGDFARELGFGFELGLWDMIVQGTFSAMGAVFNLEVHVLVNHFKKSKQRKKEL